ncbi:MAG: DMT family transporter [Spirochaetales bacterium]
MKLYRAARSLVVLGVAFASLSAILIRISDAPPVVIAFYRMLFTSAMLTPLFAASRRPRHSRRRAAISERNAKVTTHHSSPTREGSRPHRQDSVMRDAGGRPLTRRDVFLLVASGAFLAIHFASWNASLSYTTVASSVVLVTLHPMFVALGSVAFLGERVPGKAFGYISLAIVGSALLSYGDFALGPEALLGNMLAVIGAIAVAGYMLIGRFLRRSIEAKVYNITVYSVAAVILFAIAIARGDALSPYPLHEFLIFAALAFFCTILGHSIFNWALKYVSASSVSTSILLEPIFASLMALFLFAEVPGPMAIGGGAIVVVSLYMVLQAERTQEQRK